jgi:hypothetical protein
MFMAICTPSDPLDEFVLTDNCYHVFEGPNRIQTNVKTGESGELAWTSFHEFAPISPKLMIVLRSFLLPSTQEDVTPAAGHARGTAWSMAVDGIFGSDTNSMLADLPVSKPRNNYTYLVNGTLQLNWDEDGSLRQNQILF